MKNGWREKNKYPGTISTPAGRYGVEALLKYWNRDFESGNCSLPLCQDVASCHPGTLEEMLLSCPSLSSAREDFESFENSFFTEYPGLYFLINECLATNPVQFWLDASVLPGIIDAVQCHGEVILSQVFKFTHHYCFKLHSLRLKLLNDKE